MTPTTEVMRDDAAEALAHHQFGRGAREAEGRRQIDRDDVIPILVLHLHEQIVAGDAGIGDEDVDLPHRRFGRRHQRLDLGGVGEIAGQHVNALAELGRRTYRAPRGACRRAPRLRPARAAPARSRRRCRRSRRSRAPSCQSDRTSMSPYCGAAPPASASFAAAISFGPADRNADRAVGDALDQPGQHLAGADLEKPRDALAGHIGHQLAPAHRAGDLLDQAAADLVRIADRATPARSRPAAPPAA